MNFSKSKELYDRACNVLAGGVSSEFRKFGAQPHPLFYVRGEGAKIWDADGNEFLDFTLSQGPLIVGHSHPHVLETVAKHSASGQIFAGQHMAELELAEKLQQLIPCAELMRFSLAGSEADHAALRLSRAATGRPKFIRFEGHYHGWYDNAAVGVAAPSVEALGSREHPNVIPWTQGLPPRINDELILLPWNDLALLTKTVEEHHESIAAIINEPVMCNNGCIPPQPGFHEGVRELCDRFGIVMIFDEVITGFRLGLGGAQKHFGVTPDLAIFGKAMASGYPISFLAGKRKYMQLIADGTVIHAGTMNSGQPCVAAAIATIEVLERENVHEKLFRLGQKAMEGLRKAASDAGQKVLIQGYGPMFHMGFTELDAVRDYRDTLSYDRPKYARFVGDMQERGVRIVGRGLWYFSNAHTEADIDHAVKTAGEVLQNLK